MKQHMRDDEFTNTILLPDPHDVLNVESLKAIRDGDALIATGKPSRSNAKIARHPIEGLLRVIQLYEQIRLDLRRASVSSALALAKTLNCVIEDPVRQPVTLEYDSNPVHPKQSIVRILLFNFPLRTYLNETIIRNRDRF
jgi:hypothetical protein